MDTHSTEAGLDPAPDHVEPTIPVLRPRLPSAEQLLPYLRRIDERRVYTSWGPLALELEERLCRRFSLPIGGVVSASSGTSALTAAILTAAGRAAGRPRSCDRPCAHFRRHCIGGRVVWLHATDRRCRLGDMAARSGATRRAS